MAVIFVNEKGRELFLSESVLRRDLSLLQNTQVEEISEIPLDGVNEKLNTVFSKLNVGIRKISSVDVEIYFRRLLDIEDLAFIFSLSKTHFLAIVYLLYEGIMTINDIKSLIRNDYYTRNEILMIKLSFVPQNPSDDLLLAFKKFITNLEGSRLRKFVRNNFSNLYSLSDSLRIIPDHFYTLKNLFSRSNFSNFDSFSNTNWLVQNSIAINEKEKDRGYGSFENITYDIAKNPLVIIALGLITGTILFLKYKDYTSYLDYLKKTSRFKDIPGRLIDSDKVIDMTMNRFFSEEIRRIYLTRMNYSDNNEESIFSSNSLNNNSMNMFLRNSISYSISDENSLNTDKFKPRYISYFHFLYWMYLNTNNISTIQQFNYNDYESNPSNAFRQIVENSSLNSTIYNFEYLNDNLPLKNTLLDLFPETESLKRSNQSYIRRYFLDSISSSSQSITNSLYSLSSNTARIFGSLNKILDNDFLIANNGSISSLGRFGRTNYINEAIRIALESIDFEATDVSALSSFTNAQAYFNGIKTSVKNSIISQTSSNNSEISSQPSNDIFKLFLGDLVDSYFSYLVNGTNEVFAPVISENMMKTYRALNFLKHTFISMETFVNSVRNNVSYKNFMMLIFSVKHDLQFSEMEQIYKGGVTISEIEALFKRTVQNNNSASSTSTSGGSGGNTGGGGSGTRVR
jgi:hypothetical protein